MLPVIVPVLCPIRPPTASKAPSISTSTELFEIVPELVPARPPTDEKRIAALPVVIFEFVILTFSIFPAFVLTKIPVFEAFASTLKLSRVTSFISASAVVEENNPPPDVRFLIV